MTTCRQVQKTIRRSHFLKGERERHLFSCEKCRAVARAERALGLLAEWSEPPAAVSEDFVERVMRGLPRPDPGSALSWPAALRWAAAILLFAAAAGYGYRAASSAAADAERVAGSSLGADAEAGLSSLDF